MIEKLSAVKGGLTEVSLPETTEEEELGLYRRYREFGGRAIEGYEEQLKEWLKSHSATAIARPRDLDEHEAP